MKENMPIAIIAPGTCNPLPKQDATSASASNGLLCCPVCKKSPRGSTMLIEKRVVHTCKSGLHVTVDTDYDPVEDRKEKWNDWAAT